MPPIASSALSSIKSGSPSLTATKSYGNDEFTVLAKILPYPPKLKAVPVKTPALIVFRIKSLRFIQKCFNKTNSINLQKMKNLLKFILKFVSKLKTNLLV